MVITPRTMYARALIIICASAVWASPALARTENTAGQVSYSSGWSTDTSRAWSGGSAHTSRTAGAQAILTFNATSVTWIGARTPASGIARVYIDGVLRAEVDTYSPGSEEIRVPIFTVNDLAPVTHTMSIEATGQKNGGSSDSRIFVDAFDAPSISVARLQETDPAIAYSVGWTQFDQTKAWSETKAAFAGGAGAQAMLTFNGTGVSWIGPRMANSGIAAVYLDGIRVADVDTYSASQQIQAPLYDSGALTNGPHTLTVQVTGTRNSKSSSTNIYIDAFEVTVPGKRYQDTDPQVVFSGGNNWTLRMNDHAYHQGTVAEAIAGGSTATFSFDGTGVSFVSGACARCGIAQVALDGGPATTIDLYTPGDAPQKTVYSTSGLPPGRHTLTVTVTGQKNVQSSYYWVVVDAFDVISTSGGTVAPPTLVSTASRKTHAAAGTFDLTLGGNPVDPTTEPRIGGPGATHTVVFTFNKPVTGGIASIVSGSGIAGAPMFVGNEMQVPLLGVNDMQYVTVGVGSVTSADGGTGGTGSVRVGFLAGDVNSNRAVSLSDMLLINGALSLPVDATNFLRDVNASGTLSLSDMLLVQDKLTRTLPSP